MSRAERAKELFQQGYACSQAVALAFADVVKMDETTLSKLSLPFGGGLGRLRLTCGAVSGMAIIIGLAFSDVENSDENKKNIYAITQELCKEFENKNGSIICADLLSGANLHVTVGGEAEKRGEEYYKKRPCAELVYRAADILEKYLIDKGII